jgi:hypothetical protein
MVDSTWREYQRIYNQRYGTTYNYQHADDAPESVQDRVFSVTPAWNWGMPQAATGGANARNPFFLTNTPVVPGGQ